MKKLYQEYHELLPSKYFPPALNSQSMPFPPSQPTYLGPSLQPSMPPTSYGVVPNTDTLTDHMGSISVSRKCRRRVRGAAREIARGDVQQLLCTSLSHACQQNSNLSDPFRPSRPAHQLPNQSNSRRQQTTPSHLPLKHDNHPNPDFPGLSSGTHKQYDDGLCGLSVLSHRFLGIGAESAVPGPGGVVGQGQMWMLEDAGHGWCYRRWGVRALLMLVVMWEEKRSERRASVREGRRPTLAH